MNKKKIPHKAKSCPPKPHIVPFTKVQPTPLVIPPAESDGWRVVETAEPQPSPTKQQLRQQLLRMILKSEDRRHTSKRA